MKETKTNKTNETLQDIHQLAQSQNEPLREDCSQGDQNQDEDEDRPKKFKVLVSKKKSNSENEELKTQEIQAVKIAEEPKSYKKYSFDFKKHYVMLHLKHGPSKACILKQISRDLGNKWFKAYKDAGNCFSGLMDRRVNNSGPVNEGLDQYVMNEILVKRSKGLPISGQLVKVMALQAPNHLTPQGFNASNGWLTRLLIRNKLVYRKKTHQTQQLFESLGKSSQSYLDLLQGYQDSGEELIYLNFDEIHCEYDLANDSTYHLKGDKSVDVFKPFKS